MSRAGNLAVLLDRLVEVCERLGIEVSFERDLAGRGGLCRVRDKMLLLVPRALSVEEQVDLLCEVLGGFDLDQVFMLPLVREAIVARTRRTPPPYATA